MTGDLQSRQTGEARRWMYFRAARPFSVTVVTIYRRPKIILGEEGGVERERASGISHVIAHLLRDLLPFYCYKLFLNT